MYLLANYSTTQQRSAIQISRPTIPDSLQPLSVALAATLVQSFLAERATRVRLDLCQLCAAALN